MDSTALEQLSKQDFIALLLAQEARHAAEMAAMRARITELERRLGLSSSKSGKPPSSEGVKEPVRVSSLPEHSGKKPSGQKGHPGRLFSTEPHRMPPSADRGDGDRPCRQAGVRSAGTAAAGRHRASRPRRQLRSLRRADPGTGFPDRVNAPVQGGRRGAPWCSIRCTIRCCRRSAWPR